MTLFYDVIHCSIETNILSVLIPCIAEQGLSINWYFVFILLVHYWFWVTFAELCRSRECHIAFVIFIIVTVHYGDWF